MLEAHRQRVSMSSADDEHPISENRSNRGAVQEWIDHGRPISRQYSETSFTADCELNKVKLTWANINVHVRTEQQQKSTIWQRLRSSNNKRYKPLNRKRILKHVTGEALPSRLLAIMGSSGAGKTTLLNVLTKRNVSGLTVSGEIRVNGREIGSNIRSVSAYVQQEDLFIGTFKVIEHLHFQAKLRLGDKVASTNQKEIVQRVVTELGLSKCVNTIIGVKNQIKGISGGERKRLAFASEILTNPSLMFCDEPTSGLDSFMAQQVVAVLKNMADKGKTVICTIHQPSSQVFKYFDDFCLLANGRVAYMGPISDIAAFFERINFPCPLNFNPADHYIRISSVVPGQTKECKARIKKICNAYRESPVFKHVEKDVFGEYYDDEISLLDDEKPVQSKYKASWLTQYRVLFWRSFLQNVREPLLVKVRMFETIIIAVLLGLIYFNTKISAETIQNIKGLLFIFPIQMTFSFTFAVVHVFCEELPIFLREHFSSLYRVDAYFVAKTLSELPQYIIFPAVFTTIIYFMAGLTPDASVFLILLGVNILTANVGVSLGYFMSTTFADLNLAMAVTPILVIPFMIFGGFYVNENTVPVYFSWLQYLSFIKYAYEAVSINQWESIHYIPGCGNFTCPSTGEDVLKTLHFIPSNFLMNVVIMCVMFVVLRLLAFFVLLIRTYTQNE